MNLLHVGVSRLQSVLNENAMERGVAKKYIHVYTPNRIMIKQQENTDNKNIFY